MTPEDRIAALRRIVANKQYERIDGSVVDLLTASLIVQVYDALSEPNRRRYASFPADRMAQMAFKLLKK